MNRAVEVRYRVHDASVGPSRVLVDGVRVLLTIRERSPYRVGGWRVPADDLAAVLGSERNRIEIGL